jgi:DNA-binding winged helix-turn-helix (wHTH) protein
VSTRFGPFTLDLATRQLTRDNVEIHLTPKAFDLLVTLAGERPKLLSKATLLERLWPGTFVVEANLSNLVAEIRAALGDSSHSPAWIRTAHGFGYAFCGDAIAAPENAAAPLDRPLCWLEWGRRRFPLSVGEHIVGRDPDVEIRLDASTVSRRHARVVVTPERTMLDDLGSKNGSRRGEDPVNAPVQLADGDTVHIGTLVLTYHVRTRMTTTDVQPKVTHRIDAVANANREG